MSPKTPISLRLQPEWLDIVDRAARLRGRQLGVPVSRTQFIELAALAYLEQIVADGDGSDIAEDMSDLMEAMTRVIYDDPNTRPAFRSEAGIDPE